MSDAKKYIGTEEITSFEDIRFKTSLGSHCVKYTVHRKVEREGEVVKEYDVTKIITKKLFDSITTDQPTNMESLRDRHMGQAITAVMQVLMEYGLESKDAPYFLTQLGHRIQDAFERSAHFKWFGNDENWYPGMSFMDEISLLEADIEMKSHDDKND